MHFLKKLLINTGVTVAGFAIIGVGGYLVALIVHGILWALKAGSIDLPPWTYRAETWSVGAFLLLLMFLAAWLALKDVWLVGGRAETEDEVPDPDQKEAKK